jgi:hypothetical protein
MEILKKHYQACAYNATCIFFVLCTLTLGVIKKKSKNIEGAIKGGTRPAQT